MLAKSTDTFRSTQGNSAICCTYVEKPTFWSRGLFSFFFSKRGYVLVVLLDSGAYGIQRLEKKKIGQFLNTSPLN